MRREEAIAFFNNYQLIGDRFLEWERKGRSLLNTGRMERRSLLGMRREGAIRFLILEMREGDRAFKVNYQLFIINYQLLTNRRSLFSTNQ
jgi:hypothetical protein